MATIPEHIGEMPLETILTFLGIFYNSKSLKTSVFGDLPLKTHVSQPVGRETAREPLKTTGF
jgi:hypothetical protein